VQRPRVRLVRHPMCLAARRVSGTCPRKPVLMLGSGGPMPEARKAAGTARWALSGASHGFLSDGT
jgi:hypothetical protein